MLATSSGPSFPQKNENHLTEISHLGDQKKLLFQKELLIKKIDFGASGDPTLFLDEVWSRKQMP